ncbi:MAG: tRNA epoxyqueuosine(34) reductase QueG [Pseudomonadota bacterium]|nr:tRNA epoxyqueuosine(34) reductase QueG [Pseudomonadota bacterium]
MHTATLKAEAAALGFTEARICRADEAWAAGERLAEFVGAGMHGSMAWMEDTLERRKHPTAMWPDAKSAVVVAMNYGPDVDPLALLERKSEGVISVYAQNADYHDLMKKRLKRLARAFAEETGEDVKVFVDTAPLMEKPLAGKAGMGWQGKHTNLVSRAHGSWLFLGVMLTTAVLKPDEAETDHCGSCRACLDICPTNAFPEPYRLDARRCISYLTIEHKGPIPEEFRAPMGNRIYGCDDCLAICPWNKFAAVAHEAAFHPRPELKGPLLAELAALDGAEFRQVFTASPVKRIGRDRFVRNVMIAIGNSSDADLIPMVLERLGDTSPLVRGMAVWALGRLDPARARDEAERHAGGEDDPDVLREWARLPDA